LANIQVSEGIGLQGVDHMAGYVRFHQKGVQRIPIMPGRLHGDRYGPQMRIHGS